MLAGRRAAKAAGALAPPREHQELNRWSNRQCRSSRPLIRPDRQAEEVLIELVRSLCVARVDGQVIEVGEESAISPFFGDSVTEHLLPSGPDPPQ